MIKFIIKLAIVGLIANATWRIGNAYAGFYRYQDAVHQAVQFRGRKADEEVRLRVVELAGEYDLPIRDEDVTMRKEFNHYLVDASYVRPIEVFPGYTYPWPFAAHIDVFIDK